MQDDIIILPSLGQILIVLIIIVGITLSIQFMSKLDCHKSCRQNLDMIHYANVSGHGIDHVCYDSCEGGATQSGTY